MLKVLLFLIFASGLCAEPHFFRASKEQPYHLSVGAVLINEKGQIACHHFPTIGPFRDIYILMRETMEAGETPLDTLRRGLKEEFGATAEPLAFLGSLKGKVWDMDLTFEKTTLYYACRVKSINPAARDPNDPEAGSLIEWHDPDWLVTKMKQQGALFQRVDLDESSIILRAEQHNMLPRK